MERNWMSHTFLAGNENSAAAVDNSLALPRKVKHKANIEY